MLYGRYDAADMNIFRSALSTCVVSGLEHVRNLIGFARKQMIDEQRATTENPTASIVAAGTLSAAVGALVATLDHIGADR